MALPVLDGNQSATTLSSVVTGGEHIVAHSVVSLGTTAISNIATAVSGVSISISGTPSTTFGAVTGSVSILGTPTVTIPGLAHLGNSVATDGVADATTNFVKIGGHQSGQNQTSHIVHVSAGGSMSVDASGSSVTFSQASVTFGAITGSASILNFPSTQTIAGTVTANVPLVDASLSFGVTQGIPVYLAGGKDGVVIDEINYVNSIVSLPAIAGTVTANLSKLASHASSITKADNQIQIIGGYSGGSPTNATAYPLGVESTGYINSNLRWGGTGVLVDTGASALPVQGTVTVGNSVTIGSLPAISGTVTVSNTTISSPVFVKICGERYGAGPNEPREIQTDDSGLLYVRLAPSNSLVSDPVVYDPVAGAAYINVRQYSAVTVGNTVTVSQSGSVTANSIFPRVTLIDGSGTVTTANTAITVFASSSTRSYLLVQVTTGSAFVNVGATATTVNGINLTAGQGYSWETTIPQGIVSLISTTTSSRYVAKEA